MTLPFQLNGDGSFQPWFYQRLEDCARSSILLNYIIYQPHKQEEKSIIAPILDLASYSGQAINCKRVNPSYSLEALEFKRASNHYLGTRDLTKLDLILQQCKLGTFSYSILSEEQYITVQKSTIRYVSDLKLSKGLLDLADAIEQAQHSASPYVNHENQLHSISTDPTREILEYIQERDPELVLNLRKAVKGKSKPETVPDEFIKVLT
jgi:hypothetical protein